MNHDGHQIRLISNPQLKQTELDVVFARLNERWIDHSICATYMDDYNSPNRLDTCGWRGLHCVFIICCQRDFT